MAYYIRKNVDCSWGKSLFELTEVKSIGIFVCISGQEKLSFLVHKSPYFWSKFRRMLCTSKFCAPCDVRRYTCLPHCVPCHVPNEIDYGNINFETNSGTAVSTRMTLVRNIAIPLMSSLFTLKRFHIFS